MRSLKKLEYLRQQLSDTAREMPPRVVQESRTYWRQIGDNFKRSNSRRQQLLENKERLNPSEISELKQLEIELNDYCRNDPARIWKERHIKKPMQKKFEAYVGYTEDMLRDVRK